MSARRAESSTKVSHDERRKKTFTDKVTMTVTAEFICQLYVGDTIVLKSSDRTISLTIQDGADGYHDFKTYLIRQLPRRAFRCVIWTNKPSDHISKRDIILTNDPWPWNTKTSRWKEFCSYCDVYAKQNADIPELVAYYTQAAGTEDEATLHDLICDIDQLPMRCDIDNSLVMMSDFSISSNTICVGVAGSGKSSLLDGIHSARSKWSEIETFLLPRVIPSLGPQKLPHMDFVWEAEDHFNKKPSIMSLLNWLKFVAPAPSLNSSGSLLDVESIFAQIVDDKRRVKFNKFIPVFSYADDKTLSAADVIPNMLNPLSSSEMWILFILLWLHLRKVCWATTRSDDGARRATILCDDVLTGADICLRQRFWSLIVSTYSDHFHFFLITSDLQLPHWTTFQHFKKLLLLGNAPSRSEASIDGRIVYHRDYYFAPLHLRKMRDVLNAAEAFFHAKPSLYVEGDLDAALYSMIFPDMDVRQLSGTMNILPYMQGISRVREAINALGSHNRYFPEALTSVYAVVDLDQRSPAEIAYNRAMNVYTLQVSAIECVYVSQPLLRFYIVDIRKDRTDADFERDWPRWVHCLIDDTRRENTYKRSTEQFQRKSLTFDINTLGSPNLKLKQPDILHYTRQLLDEVPSRLYPPVLDTDSYERVLMLCGAKRIPELFTFWQVGQFTSYTDTLLLHLRSQSQIFKIARDRAISALKDQFFASTAYRTQFLYTADYVQLKCDRWWRPTNATNHKWCKLFTNKRAHFVDKDYKKLSVDYNNADTYQEAAFFFYENSYFPTVRLSMPTSLPSLGAGAMINMTANEYHDIVKRTTVKETLHKNAVILRFPYDVVDTIDPIKLLFSPSLSRFKSKSSMQSSNIPSWILPQHIRTLMDTLQHYLVDFYDSVTDIDRHYVSHRVLNSQIELSASQLESANSQYHRARVLRTLFYVLQTNSMENGTTLHDAFHCVWYHKLKSELRNSPHPPTDDAQFIQSAATACFPYVAPVNETINTCVFLFRSERPLCVRRAALWAMHVSLRRWPQFREAIFMSNPMIRATDLYPCFTELTEYLSTMTIDHRMIDTTAVAWRGSYVRLQSFSDSKDKINSNVVVKNVRRYIEYVFSKDSLVTFRQRINTLGAVNGIMSVLSTKLFCDDVVHYFSKALHDQIDLMDCAFITACLRCLNVIDRQKHKWQNVPSASVPLSESGLLAAFFSRVNGLLSSDAIPHSDRFHLLYTINNSKILRLLEALKSYDRGSIDINIESEVRRFTTVHAGLIKRMEECSDGVYDFANELSLSCTRL